MVIKSVIKTGVIFVNNLLSNAEGKKSKRKKVKTKSNVVEVEKVKKKKGKNILRR